MAIIQDNVAKPKPECLNSEFLLELRMMEGGDNSTASIGRVNLQSNRHHQHTNTQLSYRSDALPVAQPAVSWFVSSFVILILF